MGFKETYHSLEDKWYSILDTLDEKGIPVYKVIDPVDRVIPSLIVFSAIVLALIFGIVVLPVLGFSGTDVVVTFTDDQGKPISGLEVQATYDGKTLHESTNSVGKAVFNGIPYGKEITIHVDDATYELFSRNETIGSENKDLAYTLSPRAIPPSALTFQLTDAGGQSLDGKTIQVDLVCSNGVPLPQSQFIIGNGVLTITPPAGCGVLIGSISGNGIQRQDGILFSADSPIIRLQGLSSEKGKAKITVRSGEDDSILLGMDVELFTQDGLSVQTITTNSFGVAIFNDVPVGNYYVTVNDPQDNFALSTSQNFSIPSNQTVSVDVSMGKDIQGTLSVSVKDKASNAWVPNATVKLVRKGDNKLIATQQTTTQETPILFDVTEKGPFLVWANHPLYLSESKETGLVTADQTLAFALEKLTPQNSGKITVNVKDEDELPVDNAQVVLYDAASGFIAHGYNPRITDSNGNAKFEGVQSGTYFARATKYPAGPSNSSNFTTEKSIPSTASITLKIGQAAVQVIVKDPENNPVPFATVEFLTDGSDECLPGKCSIQTDAQGVASKSFKADRKIYVKARATGFSSFASISKQLYAGTVNTISVKLPKTILGNNPKIVLAGMYDPLTNTLAKEIKSGKTYLALFQLQIPAALNSIDNGGGIHIRVGNEAFLENDVLTITGLNAPGTVSIKGTSYQPNAGYTADQQYLTNGNAKWANIAWADVQPGVYEVGALIRVNEEAGPLEEVPIYYRAWVIEGSNYARDPLDTVLGTSANVSQKEGQYAETYQQIYFNGKPIVCDETFCYSGESILNLDDSLLVDGPPYPLSVNKSYQYSFVLTSNSPTIYPQPKLRMFVSNNANTVSAEAQFTSYHVLGTQGQPLDGSGLATNDIPGGEGQGLNVGKLEQYKTIVGQFNFLAKQTEATNLVVQLISEGGIVFQQIIPLSIASSNTLALNVNPNTASAFLATTFDIHVQDNQGFDIQDAAVSLLKIDPNQNKQLVTHQFTDIAGKTSIIAPASLPRTHFVFDAVKGGYSSDPVTIIVDENVVVFEPRELVFNLPNSPNTDQFLPLDITNLTQQNIVISKAILTGDFQGFLSNGEMQNWVQQYAGITSIDALETKTIQVKASTAATVNLISGKTLKGTLLLTFRLQGSQQEWVQAIPLKIQIKIVSQCDSGGIQLSGTPASGRIETSAFDNATQIPFQIANTCVVDAKPLQLRNLKTKAVWKSNPIGNLEMSLTDIEGSNNITEVLRNGVFVPLFDPFRPVDDTIYESILTFTPIPGHVGETAEFTVFIAGEAGVGNQTKTIQESFDLKIHITNFESCIKFDPEPEQGIKIKMDEDEKEFEIDSSECGNIPIDIQFCSGANNSNCSGGAPEGRLYLSQYSINNLKGSKTITIERRGGTLPGTYDLTVDARIPGTSFRRIASLNVKVESDASYAFEMEDSDFSLYQKFAKDSTTVFNRQVIEDVRVTAGLCDWEDVAKRGGNSGLALAGGAGVGMYAALQGWAIQYTTTTIVGVVPFSTTTTICGPVCVGISIAVIVFFAILQLFDDPCDDDLTETLPDYIINLPASADGTSLPPDAIDIRLSPNVSGFVSGEWNTVAAGFFEEDNKTIQTVGAVFTNNTGYSNPNPLFGVATLRSNEHVHGDPSHSGDAATTCYNSNFGPYFVGPTPEQGSCSPAYDTTREEKFHVKFRTQDINQALPNLQFDTVSCLAGNTLGATGKGTLPRIAFNWSWNDNTGIPIKACDATNPSAVFCDATQFNIDLMKRVKVLDAFLAANNYLFDCPENPNSQPASQSFPNSTPTPSGFIGFTTLGYAFQNQSIIQFSGTISNQTNTSQDATFTVTMTPPLPLQPGLGGFTLFQEKTCSATVMNIPIGGTATAQCTINGLQKTIYTTTFGLTSSTTSNIAYNSAAAFAIDVGSYSNASQGTCNDLLKTTGLIAGKPGINRWIDKNDPEFGQYVRDNSITFTPEVPDVQTLTSLLHYDAYLIRDGYSNDFENDFRDYYSTNAFADAPSWFKGSGAGIAGFNAFYGNDDQLVFSNKYFADTTLPAAGKYHVDISAFFGSDWKLLDSNGQPKATIGVDFYHSENPSPNSPFYKLPFDGQVGLNNTTYDRVGYGLEYINTSATPIKINDSLVRTFSGEGSSALGQVNVKQVNDLRVLNSIPSTRGNLLEVNAPAGSASQSIVFSPSLATPLMMKITHANTPLPFSVFYQLTENGSPIDTGNTLTLWEGAGNCYDYTGVPVYERYNFTPDRAATPQDKLTAWQYSYVQDWPRALVSGNEYLRTILYTPSSATGSFGLQIEGGGAKLFTSNYSTPSTNVLLDGITTLPYNNASTTIDSIQDVFDLVADKKICVSDSGSKARFFWNPETLYKQTSQTSISAFTNSLVAGQTCLGPPGT